MSEAPETYVPTRAATVFKSPRLSTDLEREACGDIGLLTVNPNALKPLKLEP